MKERVVTFHYVLKDGAGKTLESSREGEALSFLEGSGQIIPGLESQIKSMKVGDRREVKVPSAEAYGEFQKELVLEVPLNQLPKEQKVKVGDRLRGEDGSGESVVFTVVGMTPTHAKVDGNHPLAGQDLVFDVEITELREATKEEVEHGHAHGEGGHHHH